MKRITIFIFCFVIFLSGFTQQTTKLIPYRNNNNKFGFATTAPDKRIVIECVFEDARPFVSGRAAVRGKVDELKEGWFFINAKSERISDVYDEVMDFDEKSHVAVVRRNKLYGIIGRNGQEILPPTYAYIDGFNNGCSWAFDSSTRKYFVINAKGQAITNPIYDFYRPFNEGRAICAIYRDNSIMEYHILNTKGRNILKEHYNFIDDCGEGMHVVRKDSLHGYLNKRRAKLKIGYLFKYAYVFSEKKAVVVLSNASEDRIIINKRGKQLFKLNYRVPYEVSGFSCGMLPVYKDSLFGYADANNNLVINFAFKGCTSFKEGIASVKSPSNGKWAFIRVDGSYLTEFKFDENLVDNCYTLNDESFSYKNGLCRIIYQGLPGYIDLFGNEFWSNE